MKNGNSKKKQANMLSIPPLRNRKKKTDTETIKPQIKERIEIKVVSRKPSSLVKRYAIRSTLTGDKYLELNLKIAQLETQIKLLEERLTKLESDDEK
jgi:hypothetical protein